MNDWIVANINNPTFDVSDFHNVADMTLDNTLMLKKEDYLKSNYIKSNPLFLDDKGEFSEDKFDNFYNDKLKSFDKFKAGQYSGLELDMFDTDRTSETRVRNPYFNIGKSYDNPRKLKIGIEGVNVISDPEFTDSEIAQLNKIYDTAKGEFKDYSPNDKALTSNPLGWLGLLFSDPLILATWDEDGEHTTPDNRVVKHRKGDLKTNENGSFYYETLNGRSPIGKLVLSSMDIITVDGQGLNKYDFFDSDDVEKSVPGVIAKNIASLIPLFIGGEVAAVYSAAMVGREFAKSLPMLYNMITAFNDSETPAWANSIAAMGEKFTGGTSEYGKSHSFSFENFGNMAADVALQWGQQKAIAQAFNKVQGGKNFIEEAKTSAKALYDSKKATLGAQAALNDADWMSSALGLACLKKYLPEAEKAAVNAGKLGRDMSLAYMAIVSNSDVFNDMREQGLTKTEAAAIALGSTIGMYSFDKMGIGELMFDDATSESVKAARYAIRKELKEANGQLTSIARNNTKTEANKLMTLIHTAANKTKDIINRFGDDIKYHTTNFVEKSLGEGLEEVGEEVITDTSKWIYELAGKLGADTTSTDVGSFDNMGERYLQSFLGGAVGGAIFYGKEVFDRGTFKRPDNEELATLIRNGHTNELYDELNKVQKKGKAGSTKLSVNYELTDDNNAVFLTAKNDDETQNNKIAQLVREKITAIDAIINNNQLNLNDEDLFRLMVLAETRYVRYKLIAPITNYYEDFNKMMMNLIDADINLKKASMTIDGTVNGSPIPNDTALKKLTPEQELSRQENILKLRDKLEEARNKRNEFLSGDTSLDYTRKLNFAIDPILHSLFLPLDEDLLWEKEHPDVSIKDASEEDVLKFVTETLPNARNEALKQNLTPSWERYKQIESVIAPELTKITENSANFKNWAQLFNKILESKEFNNISTKYLGWNSKLDSESDEDYEARDKLKIDPVTGVEEAPLDFLERQRQRILKIEELNDKADEEAVNKILQELQKVNNVVDPLSERLLKNKLGMRAKDVVNRKLRIFTARNDKVSLRYANLLKKYNSVKDIDKIDKARDLIKTEEVVESNKDILKAFRNLEIFDDVTQQKFYLKDYLSEFGSDITIQDMIDAANGTNPDLDYFDNDYYTIDLSSLNQIVEVAEWVKNVLGEDYLVSAINVDDYENAVKDLDNPKNKAIKDNIEQQKSSKFASLDNEFDSLITDLNNNAIVKFDLLATIVNPISELFKTLAGKVVDSKKVVDLEELLTKLQGEYDQIDDTQDIVFDEKIMKDLTTINDILGLVGTYIYAASSEANENTPVGHNKMVNDFVKNHSDVITKPIELPTMDSDYATIYNSELEKYRQVVNLWINISKANQINKVALIIRGDLAFNKLAYKVYHDSLPDFHVKIDDKEYDLLEGISEIDTSKADTDEVGVPLFETEKLLYNNFQKAVKSSGLTTSDFLRRSRLLENILKKFDGIANLKASPIDKNLKTFTNYDKLIYLATALSYNPSEFLSKLKNKVENDSKTAPISSQEYAARVALASTTDTFKDIIKYAYDVSGNTNLPALFNCTYILGVAGSGKTSTVARIVKDFSGKSILAAGPTESQVKGLQNALNIEDGLTIESLLKLLLGELEYINILNDIDKNTNESGNLVSENKYYTSKLVNGFAVSKLKDNINFNFNKLEGDPKLIIVDEATHVPTIFAQILNKWAEQNGAQIIFMGDSNLIGYENKLMHNIRDVETFMVRTPKLNTSLRDNNILKQNNLEVTRTLLEDIVNYIDNHELSEFESQYIIAKDAVSKLNFRVYNGDEINGDLLTDSLSDDLVLKLKKLSETKTIGFIGDQNSAQLNKLKEAGVKLAAEMTLDQMQGSEFDYVVIDLQLKAPEDLVNLRNYLLYVYTLMSRGKEAAIFTGGQIQKVIGNNVISDYQAKAPSLLDKTADGTSIIDKLRKNKKDVLNQLNIEKVEENNLPQENNLQQQGEQKEEEQKPELQKEEEPQQQEPELQKPLEPEQQKLEPELKPPQNNLPEEVKLPALDFTDPNERDDEKEIDKEIREEVDAAIEESEKSVEDYVHSQFDIQAYDSATITGVTLSNEEVTMQGHDGKDYHAKQWEIHHPAEGPLRNLQALVNDGDTAFWYRQKSAWQNLLYRTKSILIYGHSFDETINQGQDDLISNDIKSRFNQSDWENGEYYLEIREDDGSNVLPLGKKEIGFEYDYKDKNGNVTRKRYIANIVFKVLNKQGRTCIFDLCGINNPKTLNDNLPIIKQHISERLLKGNLTLSMKDKLTNILATIDSQSAEYSNLFESWILEYENNKGFFKKIPQEAINKNRTTWFKKRANHTSLRLGGYVDPNSINLEEFNRHNMKDLNPEFVFSPTYIYSGKLANIDPKVRGKAVVFVTSDALLKPQNLIDEYIKQKQNPETHAPTVRMIVLGNYGLSFSQLCKRELFFDNVNLDKDYTPFRMNYLGIQMFTLLWNARASLKLFNDKLLQWKKDKGYTKDGVIEDIAEIAYLLHKNGNQYNSEIEAKLKSKGLTKSDIDNLNDFNNKDLADVPMFRLGHSEKNGKYHILLFKTGKIYDGNKANLIVINLETCENFNIFLNRLLNSVTSNGTQKVAGSLNLGFRHITSKIENGLEVVQVGDLWGIDEFIDFKQANHKRSLSGLFSYNSLRELSISYEGKNLLFREGDLWSILPSIITNFSRTMYKWSEDEEIGRAHLAGTAQVVTKYGDPQNPEYHKIDITDWYDDGTLTKANGETFNDMLDLLFHGTVEDIHTETYVDDEGNIVKRPTNANRVIKATDAPFKNGFYIRPDAVHKTELGKTILVGNKKEDITFIEVVTPDELFLCDVDLRGSGFSLALEYLKKLGKDEEESNNQNSGLQAEETEEEKQQRIESEFLAKYPQAYTEIHEYNELTKNKLPYSEETIDKIIDTHNKENILGLLLSVIDDNPYVFMYTKTDSGDIGVIGIEEYVNTKLALGKYVGVKDFNGNPVLVTEEGEYSFNTNTGNFDKMKPVAPESNKVVNMFDDEIEIGGKLITLKDAINEFVNDEEAKAELGEGILTEFNDFLSGLFDNTDNSNITKIIDENGEKFDAVYNYMQDHGYTEITEKLFNTCA